MLRNCTVSDTQNGERQDAQCILLYAPDWYEVITELKAGCIASGQPPAECQAVTPAPQPKDAPIPHAQKDT